MIPVGVPLEYDILKEVISPWLHFGKIQLAPNNLTRATILLENYYELTRPAIGNQTML